MAMNDNQVSERDVTRALLSVVCSIAANGRVDAGHAGMLLDMCKVMDVEVDRRDAVALLAVAGRRG